MPRRSHRRWAASWMACTGRSRLTSACTIHSRFSSADSPVTTESGPLSSCRTARMKGVGTVDGQVVAEAEMMADEAVAEITTTTEEAAEAVEEAGDAGIGRIGRRNRQAEGRTGCTSGKGR